MYEYVSLPSSFSIGLFALFCLSHSSYTVILDIWYESHSHFSFLSKIPGLFCITCSQVKVLDLLNLMSNSKLYFVIFLLRIKVNA